MRLYLDQMFRVELAKLLRAEGHDVLRAAEAGQSVADDAKILRRAIDEGRTLVTLDEHFGDWAILPLDRHPGVIRLKVDPTTTEAAANLLVPFLAAHEQDEIADFLVILSRSTERWIKTAEETM
jgi:predicted nuclease of predicted toxin-antitoxin system